MNKKLIIVDEREKEIFRKICTTLYLLTLFGLMVIQLYRQFVLHQPSQEWDDIALLVTINVIILLGSILFLFGRINPLKIAPGYLLGGYTGFVVLGFLFTIYKYNVLLKQNLGLSEIIDYLGIVVIVSGLLVLVWGFLAFLGHRNLEKKID
ncbi:MAG: hypothetical protein JW908_02520 [Anaerolineales bacterium]|nr:hypothetical protein [Anaerolineales bacterium]